MHHQMRILIGYDGSESADMALEDLAYAGLPDEATALIYTVTEHWLMPLAGDDPREALSLLQAGGLAQRAAVRLRSLQPGWDVEEQTGFGSPGALLVEMASLWKPDLLLVGSHGHTAAGRFFLGSVSLRALHHVDCAVRIARGYAPAVGEPLRLILGIDGSKSADAAVRTVCGRRWPAGTQVRLVNATWELPPDTTHHTLKPIADWLRQEKARVEQALETAQRDLAAAGLQISVVTRAENPKRLLLLEAAEWGAHCIFLGARGLGHLERLTLGSVSSAVAARAHCSVEVTRPPAGT